MTADAMPAPDPYWPSPWPADGRAGHRPNTTPGPGLALGPTERLAASTRPIDGEPASLIARDRGQLYLLGTDDGTARAWIERIDPTTLEPIDRSEPLDTGGHRWPGSMLAHGNGSMYAVAGRMIHRLDAGCRVTARRQLPVERPHHGLLLLSDGSLATVDVGLGPEAATLTVLDPDLEVLATAALPEPTVARPVTVRIDGGRSRRAGDGDELLVVGTTTVTRCRWTGDRLTIDPDWRPTYRATDQGGPAGSPTVVDGRLWVNDNGAVPGLVAALEGSTTGIGAADQRAPWPEPVRMLGIAIDRADDATAIEPTQLPGGWAVGSPLVTGGVAIGTDPGNSGLAAFDIAPDPQGRPRREMLWFQPFRTAATPLLFTESEELVVSDFRFLEDGTTSDDLVVLDLATGRMKARVETGATRFGGRSLTPGWERDLYYCGAGTIARVEALGP